MGKIEWNECENSDEGVHDDYWLEGFVISTEARDERNGEIFLWNKNKISRLQLPPPLEMTETRDTILSLYP